MAEIDKTAAVGWVFGSPEPEPETDLERQKRERLPQFIEDNQDVLVPMVERLVELEADGNGLDMAVMVHYLAVTMQQIWQSEVARPWFEAGRDDGKGHMVVLN